MPYARLLNSPHLDFVETLCNVPAASPTRTILPELAGQYGWTLSETIHEVCPVIQLPATFEDYLEQIDSKQRREIRRKVTPGRWGRRDYYGRWR